MNTVKLYYPEDQPNVTIASIEGSIGFRYGWDAHSKGRPIEEPPTVEQILARLIYDGRVAESDSEFHLEVLRNHLDELQSDFRDGWNARRDTFAAMSVATADKGHGGEADDASYGYGYGTGNGTGTGDGSGYGDGVMNGAGYGSGNSYGDNEDDNDGAGIGYGDEYGVGASNGAGYAYSV